MQDATLHNKSFESIMMPPTHTADSIIETSNMSVIRICAEPG